MNPGKRDGGDSETRCSRGAGAVVCLVGALAEKGERLGARFGIPMVVGTHLAVAKRKERARFFEELAGDRGIVFVLDEAGLRLQTTDTDALTVRVDFASGESTYRRKRGGGRGQMIAKAVGLATGASPKVLDATAGLGADAFVLAGLGCEVRLVERVPELHALLEDGFERARTGGDPELAEILERMELCEGDAAEVLGDGSPDVVYLDPMFPERSKSALVKQEMRLFQRLAGDDADAPRLLSLALSAASYRVVVKRPRVAPRIDGPEPSHVLEGKRNRFDVYTKRAMGPR